MRARDSKPRAEELAAVVAWLRARADALNDASEALGGRPGLARDVTAYWQRAVALRDAAAALERGEHHDAA